MKKKLAILCLTGVMVLGLTACGDKAVSTDSSSNVQQETAEDSDVTDSLQDTTETGSVSSEKRVSDREDYVGLQDLNIDEYVQLTDYKNMVVNVAKTEVTDEIIESYINSELLVGQITDRPVQNGDVVNIDYVGKKDGVAFDGGTASGHDLEIGSGSFIPGFEEGLIGVNPGETVDLDLSFPEGYPAEDLAGQSVVFTVTVNSIMGSAEYATVTDEDLKTLGVEFGSKEELWEAGKKELEQQAERSYQTNINNAIMTKLYEGSTVENVPEYFVEEEIQNYNLYMEKMCTQMYGVDLETFVTTYYEDMTMEKYNEQIRTMSETIVKQYMIMEAVYRAESLEVTDEMINNKANEEAPNYGFATGEELIADTGYTAYRMYVMQEIVLDHLNGMVTVEEPVEE